MISWQEKYGKEITPLLNGLDSREWRRENKLSARQLKQRQSMFKWLVKVCKQNLTLNMKSCEHAMRLFDKYVWIYQSQQPQEVYKCSDDKLAKGSTLVKEMFSMTKDQVKLTMITSLFISAKFMEIYPPSINDFCVVVCDMFKPATILSKELDILKTVGWNINLSTVSYWYQALYHQFLPQWGFDCYVALNPNIENVDLAMIIKAIDSKNMQLALNLTRDQLIEEVLTMLSFEKQSKMRDVKNCSQSQ